MTLAVLSVWKEETPEDYFAVVVVDDEENFSIEVLEKEDRLLEVILKLFSADFKFENCTIYMTITPSFEFIDCSNIKGVDRIVYLKSSSKLAEKFELIKLEPFMYTFGKIIDILMQYKPSIYDR
jgi:hypothetical protein